MTTTMTNTVNLQRSVQTLLRPSVISGIARPLAARPAYSVVCRAEHGKHENLDSDSYQVRQCAGFVATPHWVYAPLFDCSCWPGSGYVMAASQIFGATFAVQLCCEIVCH